MGIVRRFQRHRTAARFVGVVAPFGHRKQVGPAPTDTLIVKTSGRDFSVVPLNDPCPAVLFGRPPGATIKFIKHSAPAVLDKFLGPNHVEAMLREPGFDM
jgi:hypothetical protein